MYANKCEYCGKFIKKEDFTNGKADSKLVWSQYPVPEPLYDVFWHIDCAQQRGKS